MTGQSFDWYSPGKDISQGYIFNFVIGGRGIGKSYGFLKWAVEEVKTILYLRRTDTELKLTVSQDMNPFKPINEDCGRDIQIKQAGKVIRIMEGDTLRGYAGALSTFHNLRSADFSGVDTIIFDEFIPQQTARPLTHEAEAFFNLYETVNRNRELKGREPVRCYFLSNAVSIVSPILSYLDLVGVLEKMIGKNREYWTDAKRSILIHLPADPRFQRVKEQTAIYKLLPDTQFTEHAINNRFAYDSFYNVRSRPLKEYTPVVAYDGLFVYRHKTGGSWYVCRARADCPTFTADTKNGFLRNYGLYLRDDIIADRVSFSDFAAKKAIYDLLTLT